MSFHFKIESSPKQELIILSGDIDENSNFEKIIPKENSQLVIDLKDVSHLNSMGLRNWVQWVKSLKQYPGGIFLRNCPNVVVHQMNILDGFMPLHAIVESIQVPFACEHCGHQSIYHAVRGKDFKEALAGEPEVIHMVLEKPCEECGENAEADIIAAKHFRFLRRFRG